ncbi:hypothetical protein ASE48_02170 [Mycobacterium sp. Root265]|uniref:DUF222 domain-containing protein n=1 Tax=Mycobacterium sp. Root265 TaxID=1736504 RepID=UPI00070FF18B|nr:DUF222 domain-containing protein [Mycobacterium sp. Root265]KRD20625.1 hypothetical protein ASE48_02170 [Mycobacterium sp. Root265]
MLANVVADREAVTAAFDAYDAACERLAELNFTRMDPAELFALQSRREHRTRTTAAVDHRILAALQAQATPKDVGARTWVQILATRLRISEAEAQRRVRDARDLGPRYSMDGQTLDPELAVCAAALADGSINSGHVDEIRGAVAAAAKYATPTKCAQLERDLVDAATGISPRTLREVATYALCVLNQDGDSPDVAAHTRGITLGRQDADGLIRVTGWVDPELGAYLKTVNQVWGAPGVNNPVDTEPINNPTPNPLQDNDELPAPEPVAPPAGPDDPTVAPGPVTVPAQDADQSAVSDEALDERRALLDVEPDCAASRDDRSAAQRNHDALKAVVRNALMSKELGQHNGLPVTVVVSTTLAELQSGAGLATTSAGTRMPIRDLIRLAEHAYHYLLVYRHHTAEPLYLGRTKRLANKAQRLVMISRDRGCTMPGCPAAGADCQGMHAELDWEAGGRTDITGLGLGCGWDNRLAYETGWTNSIDANGRIHWHPPPLLDTGQPTLNYFHHPEDLLRPPEDD